MDGVAEVLFSEDQIQRRVRELGEALSRHYEGRSPVFISVLKGGTVFLADLMRQTNLPLKVDFMSISAYGATPGVVRIIKDLDQVIGGEDVVLVEDIIDTGLTLSYLLSALWARGPATVEVCTLLDKSARRIAPVDIRYIGFDCPDRFLVGYGLDIEQRYRNLPFLLTVTDMDRIRADPDALLSYLAGEAAGARAAPHSPNGSPPG